MIANGIDMMEAIGQRRMETISIGKMEKRTKNVKIKVTTTGTITKMVVGSSSIKVPVAAAVPVLSTKTSGVQRKIGTLEITPKSVMTLTVIPGINTTAVPG